MPSDKWGETIKALVVLVEGQSVTEQELIDFCFENLAKFKVPRSIDFLDDFPRDPNGKVYKRKLRDPYWALKAQQALGEEPAWPTPYGSR